MQEDTIHPAYEEHCFLNAAGRLEDRITMEVIIQFIILGNFAKGLRCDFECFHAALARVNGWPRLSKALPTAEQLQILNTITPLSSSGCLVLISSVTTLLIS